MPDTDITIRIINEIEVDGALSKTGTEKSKLGESAQSESKSINFGKLGYQYGRKIAAAFGNEQINQVSQAVSTGIRYAGKIAKHGVVGIAEVAVDIGVEALTKAIENAKKIAAINNEAITNCVLAGTLDISNANITSNFFTGQYGFSSK